jgi:hypothetical protein
MSDPSSTPNQTSALPEAPPDVTLMLRTHAEQRHLAREVIPTLRQVEARKRSPEEPPDAPLAYLEALWLDAQRRAAETDSARRRLEPSSTGARPEDRALHAKACRYYDSVRSLREVVIRRMARLPLAVALKARPGPDGPHADDSATAP